MCYFDIFHLPKYEDVNERAAVRTTKKNNKKLPPILQLLDFNITLKQFRKCCKTRDSLTVVHNLSCNNILTVLKEENGVFHQIYIGSAPT